MSRRHLTLVVVALASMVVSACSASPTAPRANAPTPAGAVHDSTSLTGWSGSNG